MCRHSQGHSQVLDQRFESHQSGAHHLQQDEAELVFDQLAEIYPFLEAVATLSKEDTTVTDLRAGMEGNNAGNAH